MAWESERRKKHAKRGAKNVAIWFVGRRQGGVLLPAPGSVPASPVTLDPATKIQLDIGRSVQKQNFKPEKEGRKTTVRKKRKTIFQKQKRKNGF